jgi:hypothetical protein
MGTAVAPLSLIPQGHSSGDANVKSFETRQRGKVGWLLLWLLGVPIPVLLFLFLIRGCT